eukprot:s172_g13.t1
MTELEEIRQRRAAAWEQAQQAREREGSTASNDAPVGEAAPAGPTASAAPADVSAERCCRICFDSSESKEGANGSSEPGGETGKLFSPCQCTGSMRFVHVSCLNDWRSASCNDRSYYRCDACHYEYRLQRLWVADVLISPGFHLALAISCFSFSALMVGILGRLLVPWVVDLCMDHLHLAPNVRFLFSDKDALANGNPACWQQGYTFQVCCSRGRPGNPICWDDLHTYESCCLGVSQALRSLRGVAGRVGDRMGDKVGEDKVGDKVREAWGNAGGSWQIVLLVAYLPGRSRQLFFGPTSAPAISRHFPNASLQRGSAVLAMVQVEIWSLTLASVKAVGSIAVMAAGGFLMTRLGIITNDVRKGLGELSMNLLLPCLMFSQVIYCNSKEMGGNVCPNMAQVIMSSADLFLWPIVVVTSGYCLGFLAAKLLRVPENFRRAAAGSVAFGNSTGMPVVLLSTMAPSLVAEGVVKGDPLLFLPVYLVLSPLLQWTVGSYIFRGPKVTEKSDVENPAPAADAAGVASIPSIPEASIPEANVPPMDSTYSAKSVPVQVTRAATSQGVFREVPASREEVRYQTISFGIEPPLQVGPGLSAQGELEDVLTPEDVQLPCQRDRCGKRLKHILFMFLSPPVAATLLGILVAFIRPLQNQFVNLNDWTLPDQRALDWAYNAVRTLGQAAVPVNLLMLGSNLSKGADFSALPVGMAIGLTLTKMLLQPAVVAFFVFCVSRLIPGPVVTGKWLVAIVVSLTPTANNIMVQVEVGGQDKAAMTTLIFIQYLLSPILLTISLTATSALMQVDGFLPHGSLPDFHAQTRMRLRGDELRPPSCWPGQSSYRKVEPTVTLIGFLSRV